MPRTTSHDRARRRQRLIELLREGVEATQEEIRDRLAEEGFVTTQATISRDLDDVGAIRKHDGGRTIYAMPDRNGPPLGFGRRVFAELVRDVAVSQNLVVVRTFPGMAPTVGAVLDQASDVRGILGTVAGDDTVLVVADEKVGGQRVAKAIEGLRT